MLLLSALVANAGPGDDERLQEAVLQTRGRRGTVMVLWPRIIPHTEAPDVTQAASELQRKLDAVVRDALPLEPRQLAPAPQRVCARPKGCRGHTVGVLLGQEGGGCVAVGWVGEPGDGPRHLVPLAGKVTLASDTVPFRAHPEDVVSVREFVPCEALAGSILEADLTQLLRRWVR